jgi:ADP-heptose:LPS heptosyltransferase
MPASNLDHCHFLICRTDNIGDLVLTLPIAAWLKQQLPDCHITFCCRAYAAATVARCRFVDAVIERESLTDPVAQLTAGGYGCVIFAFPDRQLAKAAKQAKIALRVGTSHRLYHWLYCNRLAHFSRVKSGLHEAQLNFALLGPLGIDYTPPIGEIPLLYGLDGSTATASVVPASESRTVPFEREHFNLILHPKSNGNGREWPLEYFVQLAQQLQADSRIRCWISGSAAEGELLAKAAPALFALPNVRSLCGQFNLAGFIECIAACDGLIASGTGPLHLAAALGKPTLGLFPPLKPIDPARWAAIGSRARNLVREEPCQGCPGAHDCACMRAIKVEQVRAVVTGWLADYA